MTHLITKLIISRDEEDIYDNIGGIKRIPSGRQTMSLTMMDVNNGQVTDIDGEIMALNINKRPPTFGEMDTSSKALGKGVGEKISKVEYDRVKTEMETYRQKSVSAEDAHRRSKKLLDDANSEIIALRGEIEALKKQTFSESQKNLLGASVDHYIETHLLPTQQYKSYEEAKRLYKTITGRSWVDGSEEDEEGDLEGCACVGTCGCSPEPSSDHEKKEASDLSEMLKDFGLRFEEFHQKKNGGRRGGENRGGGKKLEDLLFNLDWEELLDLQRRMKDQRKKNENLRERYELLENERFYDPFIYGGGFIEKKWVPDGSDLIVDFGRFHVDESQGLWQNRNLFSWDGSEGIADPIGDINKFKKFYDVEWPRPEDIKKPKKKKQKKTMTSLDALKEQQRFVRQGPQQKKRAPRNL